MGRLGILTYHHYYNYGSALQAYALQKYLSQNFDCDVEIIDYISQNEYVGKKLLFKRIERITSYIKEFPKYFTLSTNRSKQIQKMRMFDQFFEKVLVVSSQRVNTINGIKQLCQQYQGVMIGSDQTWNPHVTCWKAFLLDYFEDNTVIKLSYAPSLGTAKLPAELVEIYKNALSKFQALSCRERGGAAFLSELLNRKVEFALDPTLLLTPEDWEEIASPVDVKEPYLLTYFLGDNKEHRKAVARIAAEKDLKIVALPVSYLEIKNKAIDRQYVGPGGFIFLVKNASFICTDSFHGTMFSINFGKDFVSFPKRNDADINSDNNRLYDVLQVFGLEERLGTGDNIATTPVDYEAVNKKLTELRESSRHYLKNAMDYV